MQVTAVYVEATAEETEGRLLKGLRKHCPDVPENQGVIETLAALRRGRYLPAGKKVVIVLDQFEQWLHAKKEEKDTELGVQSGDESVRWNEAASEEVSRRIPSDQAPTEDCHWALAVEGASTYTASEFWGMRYSI